MLAVSSLGSVVNEGEYLLIHVVALRLSLMPETEAAAGRWCETPASPRRRRFEISNQKRLRGEAKPFEIDQLACCGCITCQREEANPACSAHCLRPLLCFPTRRSATTVSLGHCYGSNDRARPLALP